jgi:hypothetical protein
MAFRFVLPGTEVVHLAYATLHFTAVVRAVGLPIQANRAPWWAAITLTNENIFVIEV